MSTHRDDDTRDVDSHGNPAIAKRVEATPKAPPRSTTDGATRPGTASNRGPIAPAMTTTSAAASAMTVQKRGAAATRRVRQALLQHSDAVGGTGDMEGLFEDGTLLGTALAEAVIEELERDATLRARVRAHYTDLVALKTAAAFNRFAQAPAAADITPIRRVEGRTIDPFAPPDPDFLCYVFGKAQLATVLRRYTLERLKEAAATLEARYPGTRPAHRGRLDAVITYIVEHTDEQLFEMRLVPQTELAK